MIRKALNRTQTALSSLFESIELRLRRTSTHDSHRHRHESFTSPGNNHSDESRRRRRRRRQQRDDELSGVVNAVQLCAQLSCVLLPIVAAFLVSRAAYTNYHDYVVGGHRRQVISERLWMDVGTRRTKKSRITATKSTSPTVLSAAELRRVVECSSVDDGVLVIVLHVGFSAVCCFFDLALYWLLVVVGRHTAPPPFDFTGADSVNSVTSGDGTIIAVLSEFLTILHAGHWFGFTDSGYMCSMQPATPDYLTLGIVVLLYCLLFFFVAVQSTVLSWRNRIAAYFYPEHEQSTRQFYGALVTAQRDRRLNGVDDDTTSADQRDVLRNLMCLEPTSWRPDTLLAVRRAAAPASAGPRCVACGQPVSRRLRKAQSSSRVLSNDDCLDADICPVCDCRLTPDDDVVFSNAACCMSADVTSRVA